MLSESPVLFFFLRWSNSSLYLLNIHFQLQMEIEWIILKRTLLFRYLVRSVLVLRWFFRLIWVDLSEERFLCYWRTLLLKKDIWKASSGVISYKQYSLRLWYENRRMFLTIRQICSRTVFGAWFACKIYHFRLFFDWKMQTILEHHTQEMLNRTEQIKKKNRQNISTTLIPCHFYITDVLRMTKARLSCLYMTSVTSGIKGPVTKALSFDNWIKLSNRKKNYLTNVWHSQDSLAR